MNPRVLRDLVFYLGGIVVGLVGARFLFDSDDDGGSLPPAPSPTVPSSGRRLPEPLPLN